MEAIKPPTAAQCDDWVQRVDKLIAWCAASGVHFDGGTVRWRIAKAASAQYLAPGCAARVMQAHCGLVAAGASPEACSLAYMLAREIVQHEIEPSPGWNTLVAEAGLPADPTGTIND